MRMITEQELLETIHEGIHNANKTFTTWTDGLFVSEAAAEPFTVAVVAQHIMKHVNKPPFLRLEALVGELKDLSNRSHPGRPSSHIGNNSRIDIAVLNTEKQLKFAIEAKCSQAWVNTYYDDLNRLIKLKKEFGKHHNGTALQAGILAMFVSSCSKNGYDEAKVNLEKHLEDWGDRIKVFMDKNDSADISLHRSHKKVYRLDTPDCCYLATSLCAVVK